MRRFLRVRYSFELHEQFKEYSIRQTLAERFSLFICVCLLILKLFSYFPCLKLFIERFNVEVKRGKTYGCGDVRYRLDSRWQLKLDLQ